MNLLLIYHIHTNQIFYLGEIDSKLINLTKIFFLSFTYYNDEWFLNQVKKNENPKKRKMQKNENPKKRKTQASPKTNVYFHGLWWRGWRAGGAGGPHDDEREEEEFVVGDSGSEREELWLQRHRFWSNCSSPSKIIH